MKEFKIIELRNWMNSNDVSVYHLFDDHGSKEESDFRKQFGEYQEISKIGLKEFGDYDDYGTVEVPCEYIIFLKDYNVYLKSTGSYSSYDGYDMSNFKQVFPKEKTITVYE